MSIFTYWRASVRWSLSTALTAANATFGVAGGNLLGHVLGQTLGFRHEHTRPEAGRCFEDTKWLTLTPYDSASIMHYPQCNGTGRYTMTSVDIAGVRKVYGL